MAYLSLSVFWFYTENSSDNDTSFQISKGKHLRVRKPT